MIAGFRDLIKLFGIIIIAVCAVFVCTFMLNFYIDVQQIEQYVTEQTQALYTAQKATAQFCCYITGGCLTLIAFFVMAFYIKLYIDGHAKQLGILKAMGFSERKIAVKFCVFGLSVFIGAAAGFAAGFIAMPYVYENMAIEGLPPIKINFHAVVPLVTVILPTALFTVFACLYAYFALKKPVCSMLRGRTDKPVKIKKAARAQKSEKSFLRVMFAATVSGKKALAFFVAFACFCFSAMVQMGAAMEELSPGMMSVMILLIGIVLAFTVTVMAVTSILRGNTVNIAVMRAYGYTDGQIACAVLAGYLPFAAAGFGIGTVYQYGLLVFMVNVIFKNVGEVPEYSFNVPVFFYTLLSFVAVYALVLAVCLIKMRRVSVNTTLRCE